VAKTSVCWLLAARVRWCRAGWSGNAALVLEDSAWAAQELALGLAVTFTAGSWVRLAAGAGATPRARRLAAGGGDLWPLVLVDTDVAVDFTAKRPGAGK